MATIVTIGASDVIANSRADLNTNFANLNSDKIETSVIDTDSALAANSDSKIPSQKAVKAYVDAGGNPFVVETTTGTTHSLVTVAGQRVVVWAKGWLSADVNSQSVTLKYNSVTKDTITIDESDTAGGKIPFSLMYTETPGAATHNITVETTGGTLNNVVIIVFKINV